MAGGARRNTGWAVPLVLGALVVLFVALGRTPATSASDVTVNGDAAMWYCSRESDPQCQPGVAEINLAFETRNKWLADLYDYDIPDHIRVKVQDLTVRLNVRADAVFDEEEEVFLYRDENDDGVYSSSDVRLARGLLKGKRIVFEDLNQVLGENVANEYATTELRLFMVRDDGGFPDVMTLDGEEEVRVALFKDVQVGARDLVASNRSIATEGALADRSLFDRVDLVNQSRDEVVDRYEGLAPGAAANEIILGPGRIEIAEDVVIASGLAVSVQPGTELWLAAGKSLISYSPMTLEGTATDPITIRNLDPAPFGVVGVIGSMLETEPTVLRHVHASGGSETEINGAYLSGMVSIYRNPKVIVENSTFEGAAADDGLNIKYGEISMQNNVFRGNSADAFDGDFVTGTVSLNLFEGNGNDAIDVSGSTISVEANTVRLSGDKGISIGEASTVEVISNLIDQCSIGIEVKDRSAAMVYNNAIVGSTTVGINAYVKKSFFGEPSIEYYDNAIVGSATTVSGLVDVGQLASNVTEGDLKDLRQQYDWLGTILDRQ